MLNGCQNGWKLIWHFEGLEILARYSTSIENLNPIITMQLVPTQASKMLNHSTVQTFV